MSANSALNRIKIRIGARAEAARQILIILTGLGITMSITQVFEHYKEGHHRETFIVLVVFLLYAIRFFFNNWIYLSEAYDDELLKQLEIKQHESYFSTILLCSNFDIAMATTAGLTCGIIGHALFVGGIPTTVVCAALLIHYLTDIAILGINILLRIRERDPNYDFNISRVFCWMLNNSIFCVIVFLFIVLDFSDQNTSDQVPHDELFFLIPWALNSLVAIIITAYFASRDNRATTDNAMVPALDQPAASNLAILIKIEGRQITALLES